MWGCSRALLGTKDESELLSEVCRLAVEAGGYRLAWAGFTEDDPGKTVRPVAQCGFEEGYLQTLSITWGDELRGQGPTGTAIRTAAPVVARDILTDPSFRPWRSEALSRGYCSNAAFPLGTGGRPLGVLTIYASEPGAFTEEEVRLLSELADTLAYGIRSLRAEAARGREEERRKVAEVELIRAQRMGVAKLAGGVAHNLNNLLTVINGYGSLIEKDLSAEDPRRGMLEEMLRSGERAAELTNQLLSYSRQQMLFPRELEVGALLREMEPGLRKICGPGVALTVNSGSCVLRVDPNGFRRMLVRLVTHACEEMERVGSVRIARHRGGPRPRGCPSGGRPCGGKVSGADAPGHGPVDGRRVAVPRLRAVPPSPGIRGRARTVLGVRFREAERGVHLGGKRAGSREPVHRVFPEDRHVGGSSRGKTLTTLPRTYNLHTL